MTAFRAVCSTAQAVGFRCTWGATLVAERLLPPCGSCNSTLMMLSLPWCTPRSAQTWSENWLTAAVRDGHHQPDASAALFFVAFAASETIAIARAG